MKQMKLSIVLLALLLASQTFAQKDWSKVDFIKEFKGDKKIQGAVAKSLRENPTFINDYELSQSALMKGSSQAGTLQKQGVGSVFSEAVLAGVSPEALQALSNELYQNFASELEKAGLKLTNGDALLQSKHARGQKSGKNVFVGKADGNYIFEKVGMSDPMYYSIRERYIFRPDGINVFSSSKVTSGLFYQKLASQENVNLISISYRIDFADFSGSHKGLSKNSLTTSGGLAIVPKISIVNPKGSYSWLVFKENIYGNNDWATGLVKKKSNDGSYFGLSSNADYAVVADEAKYIDEIRSIILNLQKDIVRFLME